MKKLLDIADNHLSLEIIIVDDCSNDKSFSIEEDRFDFEPEIVAKVAHMRLRIYEMEISYHSRTYEEGKKIGLRDRVRALYCIFRYNAHRAPVQLQFYYTY